MLYGWRDKSVSKSDCFGQWGDKGSWVSKVIIWKVSWWYEIVHVSHWCCGDFIKQFHDFQSCYQLITQWTTCAKKIYENWEVAMPYFDIGSFMFTFDLKSGYHHIEIFDQHQTYLGFAWIYNSYKRNVRSLRSYRSDFR